MTTIAVKTAGTCYPYSEFCPKCQKTQITRVEAEPGPFWYLTFCLGLFLFLPLCLFLCCASSKDTKHFCPSCGTLLATKSGGCC